MWSKRFVRLFSVIVTLIASTALSGCAGRNRSDVAACRDAGKGSQAENGGGTIAMESFEATTGLDCAKLLRSRPGARNGA